MKINVRLSALSSCVQGISSHVRKGWTVFASSSSPLFFLILSLPFIHFPLGPWRNGAETGPSFQLRHDGQPAPAGFGRVVYFSLSISFSLCMCVCVCVCALCSFGRGYNQPAKKENRKKEHHGQKRHTNRNLEPPMYTQCSHICTHTDIHKHGDMITISRLLFSSFDEPKHTSHWKKGCQNTSQASKRI